MKQRIRLLITLIFVVPSVALASTALVSAETSSGSSGSTTTTKPEIETETEKPDDKSLLQRLSDRKTELKIKLTTVEQERIKLKCVVAQTGTFTSLSARVKGVETSRKEVYKNLTTRLNSLVEKLKAKNVDTAKLESEIAVLKTKIDTFNTDLTKYKQAIVDLKSQDCKTDPTAFRASLEAARTLRETVSKDATAIKSYVTDTIKPTLKEIRAALEAKEKESTSTTTEGN